jgi:hypothetical protein
MVSNTKTRANTHTFAVFSWSTRCLFLSYSFLLACCSSVRVRLVEDIVLLWVGAGAVRSYKNAPLPKKGAIFKNITTVTRFINFLLFYTDSDRQVARIHNMW